MELGDFEKPATMEQASARFLDALLRGREPQRVENVETHLECGHSIERRHIVDGRASCRTCDARAAADYSREQRLPEMIENTRLKLTMLEREAKRRGQIV